MICPDCKGKKKIIGIFPVWADYVHQEKRKPYVELDCPRCKATGKVSDETPKWMKQGKIIKNRRLKTKLVLRKAARQIGIDLLMLSEMERGVIKPDLSITYDIETTS